MICPGVQIPHWNPPYSIKACCSGCSLPSFARPSMVSIFFPWQATARVKQELTTRPSIITLQAPQTPTLQPSLVTVRPMSSRRACRSNRLASSCRSYSSPLTSSRIFFIMRSEHIFCLREIQLIECGGSQPSSNQNHLGRRAHSLVTGCLQQAVSWNQMLLTGREQIKDCHAYLDGISGQSKTAD